MHRRVRRTEGPARFDRGDLAFGGGADLCAAPHPPHVPARWSPALDPIAKALRPVYTAPTEPAAKERFVEFTSVWGDRYPGIVRLWENAWAEFVPFLAFEVEVRRVIFSTNAVESLNARFRRAIRARGHFPTDQAGWIQPVNATVGGSCSLDRGWSSTSAGVFQPSRLRGRLFSCAATNSR